MPRPNEMSEFEYQARLETATRSFHSSECPPDLQQKTGEEKQLLIETHLVGVWLSDKLRESGADFLTTAKCLVDFARPFITSKGLDPWVSAYEVLDRYKNKKYSFKQESFGTLEQAFAHFDANYVFENNYLKKVEKKTEVSDLDKLVVDFDAALKNLIGGKL